MADDLKKLESLERKRKDLLKKLEMIEEKKSTVAEEVYEKVKKDYENRLDKVVAEMKTLEGAIRTEIERLSGEMEKVEAKLKEYKLQDEEIDLRYSLGEYEDEEYKKLKRGVKKGSSEEKARYREIVDRINWLKGLIGEEEIEAVAEEEAVEVAEAVAEPVEEKAEESTEVEKEAEILLEEILKATDEKKEEEEAEVEEEKKEAEKVQCPKCGFMNEPDSWYCEKCGAEILGTPEEEK
ncbi:hypothetical protein DRP53_06275 [candidate division WOR-3 bacterium]|uniref:RanBP2-type domain-containing protein n=1 Tax=candidate division WOR-3 bacterium TaxID=2052148 RepID=A0A660SGU5_UNCW3|nr:MAG: hypothetical protein DRP53_06275 [candidate division WOR-3 bacterium]